MNSITLFVKQYYADILCFTVVLFSSYMTTFRNGLICLAKSFKFSAPVETSDQLGSRTEGQMKPHFPSRS